MSALRHLPGRLLAVLALLAWAAVEVIRASAQVLRDIVVPSSRLAPASSRPTRRPTMAFTSSQAPARTQRSAWCQSMSP